MEAENLVYALSMKDRISVLNSNYAKSELEDNLSEWLNRRSLCTEEIFYEYLSRLEIPKEDFNLGIKPLTTNDKQLLYPMLQRQPWFEVNQNIFKQEEDDGRKRKTLDFSYVFRFHALYFKKQIAWEDIAPFIASKQFYRKFVNHLLTDMVQISSKTLIYDLHQQKRQGFEGETPEERFQYHMKKRFGTKKKVQEFFLEYPVLCRLLAERVQFHIKNYSLFIQAITSSREKLQEKFSITPPFRLSMDSLGAGDSHAQGKTVLLFQVNKRKLVFKYKNLQIGERLNQFLSILEEKTKTKFYQMNRVLGKDFTIEEFVEPRECLSKKEISNYYVRFGKYSAICYFLCGNDFHAENIVSYGSFPVLIDIETFLQNDNPLKETDTPYAKASLQKMQSVLSTSLLPAKYFANRLEPKADSVSEEEQGVQMSAFNSREQILPFKVLQILDNNTDNAHFGYGEYKRKGSHNIPLFHGKKVMPEDFANEVINGFVSMYTYFMENKEFVMNSIQQIFQNTLVRNVLKSTQQYMDMIDYSFHPSCMKDYLQREKLFENLWAFSYKNKQAISFEIQDLLQSDVPIFFNNTSSTALFSSQNISIANYYERTALERIKERIHSLSSDDLAFQLVCLQTSLGTYEGNRLFYRFGNTATQQLHKIVETILDRLIFDSSQKSAVYLDFGVNYGKRDFIVSSINFYDGLSGIYVFLAYYEHYYPSARVQTALKALEVSLFNKNNLEDDLHYSVYTGNLSLLTVLYYRFLLHSEQRDKHLAITLANRVVAEIGSENIAEDWLTGISGLIKVFMNFYQATKEEVFQENAKKLAEKISLSTIHLCGFSHGYSGIATALAELPQVETVSNRIVNCLKVERQHFNGVYWEDLREEKHAVAQWCHGSTGIGYARLQLLCKKIEQPNIYEECLSAVDHVLSITLEDDSICHGNMGNHAFLRAVAKSKILDTKRESAVYKKLETIENMVLSEGICLEGMHQYPTLGLMNGIAGVGFEWLRTLHIEIPDILILE